MSTDESRVARVHAVLPQTQCTRCGYPDCEAYARAIVHDGVALNRCPPGGMQGVARLAEAAGRPPAAQETTIDPACGLEAERRVAVIDEAWCIGCTLCIKACPVDCIIGTNKAMHSVVEAECTGCELCVPACPVDCISLPVVTPGRTGRAAWSEAQAGEALARYQARQARALRFEAEQADRLLAKAQHKREHLAELTKQGDDPVELARKRAVVDAALARARARRGA